MVAPETLFEFALDINQREAEPLRQLTRYARSIGLDVSGEDEIEVALKGVFANGHCANPGTSGPV